MQATSPSTPIARGIARRTDAAQEPAWRRLARFLAGSRALAAADQAVVSATSFLALIMLGRGSGAGEFGAYAIGGSVLALLLAAQDALVTRPYAIRLHRPVGTPAEHASGALGLSVLLSATGALALGATTLALGAFGLSGTLVDVAGALAGAVPFVLLREFARRFCFAHLRVGEALAIDVAVAALQFLALASLGWAGRLSAVTAFAAAGLACAIAGAGWLYLARARFARGLGGLRAIGKESWRLGKWLFAGQMALQAQGYMSYWVSVVLAGPAVTGIYAACTSIVAFANPLLFGAFNVLTPKFVRAFRDGGCEGLRREAVRDSLLIGALMAVFSLLVAIGGERLMRFLYPGGEYEGNGAILVLLALATLASAVGAPASIALASAERARAVAGVTLATSLLNVLLVLALMPAWGLLGAAWGALAAELAGSIGRWAAFLALVRDDPSAAEARPPYPAPVPGAVAGRAGGFHGEPRRRAVCQEHRA